MSTPTRKPLDSAQGKPGAPEAASPQGPPRPPQGDMFGNRRPIGGRGVPTQKAKDFKATLRRLLEYLRPHRAGLVVVILAGAIGTVFQVLGPKILGMATTKIFEGFVAKSMRIPGAAVDFDYVGRILLGLMSSTSSATAFNT
jgi:ATP-binding cassette subfamily B protein